MKMRSILRSVVPGCARRLSNSAWNQPSSSQSFGDKPIINFPVKIMRKLEKLRTQREVERKDYRQKHRVSLNSPLLITCSDRRYNHHREQFYPGGNVKLASEFWKNNKHSGDQFTLLSHGRNPSLLPNSLDEVTFAQLGLSEELLKGLGGKFKRPTVVQKLVIPRLMCRKTNVVFSSETGSGKTLAFALPVIHHLTLSSNKAQPGRPKGLILAPSKELSEQIYDFVSTVAQYTSLRVEQLKGDSPQSSVDLAVSTPGLVQSLLHSGNLDLSQLEHLVIDEADSLLDQSFSDLVLAILGQVQIQVHRDATGESHTGAQLILASATFPRDLDTLLAGVIEQDNLMVIKTANLHRLMPHVNQQFIRLTQPQKPEKILQILKRTATNIPTTLVFVKNLETCWWLTEFLRTSGIKAAGLRGNLSVAERREIFRSFRNDNLSVLVATDIASRGLDTLNVGHVVNYDFPRDLSDYIHRAGRVGRVGQRGGALVTSFVATPSEVDTVQVIETAARQASMLPNIYDKVAVENGRMATDAEEMEAERIRAENVEFS